MLVMAIALAGCSSEGGSPAASQAATTTTSAADAALVAAKEACALGDTSSEKTTALLHRETLRLAGENVEGLSDEAVLARWTQLFRQMGKAFDDLQKRAYRMTFAKARDAAARAGGLDARWGQLHRGLSGYANYLGSEFASPTDAETKGWFEDIRLGCEQARALGGP